MLPNRPGIAGAGGEVLTQAWQHGVLLIEPWQPSAVPQYAALGAAKSLAESLIRYLVIELAPLGVRINSVSPSAVDTEGLRQVYGAATKAVPEQSAKDNPSGRNVEHDDYCSLIEYLASPAAAMIQGQVIFVNGGAYLSA